MRVPSGVDAYGLFAARPLGDAWAAARVRVDDRGAERSDHVAGSLDGDACSASAVVAGLLMKPTTRRAPDRSSSDRSSSDRSSSDRSSSFAAYATVWRVTPPSRARADADACLDARFSRRRSSSDRDSVRASASALALAQGEDVAVTQARFVFAATTRSETCATRAAAGSVVVSVDDELGSRGVDPRLSRIPSGFLSAAPRLERVPDADFDGIASTESRWNRGSAHFGPKVSVVCGGLGGVGALVASERLRAGASRVVLFGRSGRAKNIRLDAMAAAGEILVARCDASTREETAAIAAVAVARGTVTSRNARDACASSNPGGSERIRANVTHSRRLPRVDVVHAGGALQDAVVGRQTVGSLAAVAAPKVSVAARLADAFASFPVTGTLLFSSVAALLGSPGQAMRRRQRRVGRSRRRRSIQRGDPSRPCGGARGAATRAAWRSTTRGLYRVWRASASGR